ncbi:MAG: signal peptidase II [Eggerthellaceae bacterium]|nr:signal peptidase II [Eggerthellaceae bacterium]
MVEEGQAKHTFDHKGGPVRSSDWTPRHAAILMAAVVVVWIIIDRATKTYFDQFPLGDLIGGPYAGLFEFFLVHNTGAAWGLFSGSTVTLGVFSLVVSLIIAAAAIVFARRSTWLLSLGAGLIVAGGIGNAIDRFLQGYVVDFINLTFIRFPVFNVADIGVTCGFVLLAVAIALFWRDRPDQQTSNCDAPDTNEGERAAEASAARDGEGD